MEIKGSTIYKKRLPRTNRCVMCVKLKRKIFKILFQCLVFQKWKVEFRIATAYIEGSGNSKFVVERTKLVGWVVFKTYKIIAIIMMMTLSFFIFCQKKGLISFS